MKLFFTLSCFLLFSAAASAQPLTLVKKGKSPYVIIVPENATIVEIQAAKVLQDYLF